MKSKISQYFKNAYDKAAESYDLTRYEIKHGELFKEISNCLAVELINTYVKKSGEESLVLDFATGTGKLIYAIECEPNIKIIGLDISFKMLSEAINSPSQYRNEAILVNGDGLEMPFKTNTFDHIISFKFLHIMENIYHYNFLKELHRVLKPGGKLIMDCNNGIFGLFLRLRDRKYSRKATRFYWPHHKYTLYKDFRIVDIVGEWLPFTSFLWEINRNLVNILNRISHHFPFYFLCGKLILIFEK